MSTGKWIGDVVRQIQGHNQKYKSEGHCENEMKDGGSLAQDSENGAGEQWINLGHFCVVEVWAKGKNIEMRASS